MKTNVTLKLDADLLREARILAAERGQLDQRACWLRSLRRS